MTRWAKKQRSQEKSVRRNERRSHFRQMATTAKKGDKKSPNCFVLRFFFCIFLLPLLLQYIFSQYYIKSLSSLHQFFFLFFCWLALNFFQRIWKKSSFFSLFFFFFYPFLSLSFSSISSSFSSFYLFYLFVLLYLYLSNFPIFLSIFLCPALRNSNVF